DHSRGRARGRRDARQPKPMPAAPDGDSEADPRARLIEGLAAALTEKGYADISVADIVQHARVSKRTFYQHFADKEACYLATYSALSEDVLGRRAAAAERTSRHT